MDFAESKEELLFRHHVRELLHTEPVATPLRALRESSDAEPDERDVYRALGAHGVLTPGWPTRYGGLGHPASYVAVLVEELMRAGVPDTLFVNSIQTVGQLILTAGSDQQKDAILPALARCERFCSVLYTEPEVGSDIGALTARAAPVAGGFRLRGTKAYNMKSDRTDYGLCVARTSDEGSKYSGITVFLVDLHADGVLVSPLAGIGDERFHRVELRDVFVPESAVIGALGDGWRLLTQALPFERIGLDFALRAERWYTLARADGGATDADIARYGARAISALLMARKAAATLATGRHDPVLTAMVKWYGCDAAAEIGGWVLRSRPLDLADNDAARYAAYREAPGLTLSGGTTDMMLQLIAGFMLGTASVED